MHLLIWIINGIVAGWLAGLGFNFSFS